MGICGDREAEDEGTTKEYQLLYCSWVNSLVPSTFCGRGFDNRYGRHGDRFNAQRVALYRTLHGLGELTEKKHIDYYYYNYYPERVERVE